jgi:hypothetical protein
MYLSDGRCILIQQSSIFAPLPSLSNRVDASAPVALPCAAPGDARGAHALALHRDKCADSRVMGLGSSPL